MRRPARALIAAAALAVLVPSMAPAAERLRLDAHSIPVDAPLCVCVDGTPPQVLHVDGREVAPGDGPRVIHLALSWPTSGPLRLFRAIPARGHSTDLPVWGQDGTLGPGRYVLTADGFAAETLTVLDPDPGSRRTRALLARARLRAEQGDSVLATRLLEQIAAPNARGAYADAAMLGLGDVLPHSRYRDRPDGWLVEWIARRHSNCIVGEGMRVWLTHHGDVDGRVTLARVVARYPETQAARAARALLTAP